MSFAKWIGGAIGWSFGGPIGAIIGVAIGFHSLVLAGTGQEIGQSFRNSGGMVL